MLEKPDLPDENIIACLHEEYGLTVFQVDFLPLGADLNTAAYRMVTDDKKPYFVKIRRGVFDETSVAYPKFLFDQGIAQVIAPLITKTRQLAANLDAFKLILYPFIEGHNAYQVNLSDRQWNDFGKALKSIHATKIPPALTKHIMQESYSPVGREIIKKYLQQIEHDAFDDPVASRLATFLRANRVKILDLVGRSERLALSMKTRSLDLIVCHSDIHAGNVLIDANSNIYIVDWDNPLLALKERDLMSIGGGLFGNWRSPQQEESLFYQGYGPTKIDSIALAYYRYERIIQDIAVYCEHLFTSNRGGEDREQSLRYLESIFLPNNTIEIAYESDVTSGVG
jgi:spectinomycin phosphotransferase